MAQSELKRGLAGTLWGPALVLLAAAACGSGPTAPTPEDAGRVDPQLVGAWVGTVEGSNGVMQQSGTLDMTLDADGSMSAESGNPAFEPVDGGWSVAQNAFRAEGNDANGTRVVFDAPASPTKLDGTWRAGVASGTFIIEKR